MNLRPIRLLTALALLAGCGTSEPPARTTLVPVRTPTAPPYDPSETNQAVTPSAQARAAAAKAAGRACPEGLEGEPDRRPPADLIAGIPEYVHVYRSRGRRYDAALGGTPADLLGRRDDVSAQLVQNRSYVPLRTKDKVGVVAEAWLRSPEGRNVHIVVSPLCQGQLLVRYTLS